MERVLVGVQGNSSRSPSSTLPPSLHKYAGSMPDSGRNVFLEAVRAVPM
jgi:hypothetical protein